MIYLLKLLYDASQVSDILKMDVNQRGIKFNNITDRFAWDFLLILSESLVQPTIDLDQLKLRILLTLSDVREAVSAPNNKRKYTSTSYVNDLLFRNYNAPTDQLWHRFNLPATATAPACSIKIHDEAITYLSSVLERRLQLAQNLIEKPGNMHALFTQIARFSMRDKAWQQADVKRLPSAQVSQAEASYFNDCAAQLKTLIKQLAKQYSEISERRRQQFGPIHLIVDELNAEMPEEMSLFEVFSALPLTIQANFFQAPDIQKTLCRVIDSLNERYKLIRAIGLPPQDWLEKDHPSIAALRELKQLRIDANQRLSTGQACDLNSAFRQAFNDKQQHLQKRKIAHCQTFDELSFTEYGQIILNFHPQSLDQTDMDSDENLLYESIAGTDTEEDLTQALLSEFDNDLQWIQLLIDDRPDLFDEVTSLFFQFILGNNPALHQQKDYAILDNPLFQKQVAHHPKYRHFNREELIDALLAQVEHIIEQGIKNAADLQMESGNV